jgi:hypothetical protein
MKFLVATLFLLLLSAYCVAQTSSDSGLTVLKQKWHRDIHDPSMDQNADAENSDVLDAEQRRKQLEQANEAKRSEGLPIRPPQPTPEFDPPAKASERSADYVYEVTFRNSGTKDISAISWEYVFLAPDSEKEVGRRHFESKETIRAGKIKNLVTHSAVPPTGTIDAAKAGAKSPEKYAEKIVIISVDYADGSKWMAATN